MPEISMTQAHGLELPHHDGLVLKRSIPLSSQINPSDSEQILIVCPVTKQHFRITSLDDVPTETQSCCPDGHWLYWIP